MKKGPMDFIPATGQTRGEPRADFEEFEATELYCAQCGRAVPVRKFLLLVLPDGDKYEYRCQYCGDKVGDKMDHTGQPFGVLKT